MNTKFLHLTDIPASGSTSVRQLSRFLPPIQEHSTCLAVLQNFLSAPEVYALPIVDKHNIPVGLIDRHIFVEYFTRKFVQEVHGKKSVMRFLKEERSAFSSSAPIIVDEATNIDDIAQIIIGAGMQHMVTGFIVTCDGVYHGVVNGYDLLHEITLRKQANLYFLAHYDHLTGLPNRMLFGDRLMQSCRDALRNNTLVGLMFVDVDFFKQINDSFGHSTGDTLLCAVAERLKDSARESDTVARLGGDEFAILMDDLNGPDDPLIIAQRMIESMRVPVQASGHSLNITVSIGIAIYPTDSDEVSILFSNADTAMYLAKSQGRNGFRLYSPGHSMPGNAGALQGV